MRVRFGQTPAPPRWAWEGIASKRLGSRYRFGPILGSAEVQKSAYACGEALGWTRQHSFELTNYVAPVHFNGHQRRIFLTALTVVRR